MKLNCNIIEQSCFKMKQQCKKKIHISTRQRWGLSDVCHSLQFYSPVVWFAVPLSPVDPGIVCVDGAEVCSWQDTVVGQHGRSQALGSLFPPLPHLLLPPLPPPSSLLPPGSSFLLPPACLPSAPLSLTKKSSSKGSCVVWGSYTCNTCVVWGSYTCNNQVKQYGLYWLIIFRTT